MSKKNVEIEDEFPSWPKQVLAGFLLMVIHQAIVIPIAVFYSQMAAFGVALLLGLFIIIGGSMCFGPSMIFAGILAIAVSGTGGMFVYEYHLAAQGPVIKNISISEVHQHQEAKCWLFVDGQPRSDLGGTTIVRTRNKDGGHSTTSYYVAPIVLKEWNKSHKVPLWACAKYRCPKSWKKAAGVGFAANPIDIGHFRSAVRDAQTRHGLKTFPDLHFVNWAESYEEELSERWNMAKYFLITFNALWFIGMGFFWLYCYFDEEEESE